MMFFFTLRSMLFVACSTFIRLINVLQATNTKSFKDRHIYIAGLHRSLKIHKKLTNCSPQHELPL